MDAAVAVEGQVPATQASHVYDRLREDLLSGRLAPSRKLQMRFLTETYQTGQTPLREALNRLTADGLVEVREQRGFYVKDISRAELAELTKTRCWEQHRIASSRRNGEFRLRPSARAECKKTSPSMSTPAGGRPI